MRRLLAVLGRPDLLFDAHLYGGLLLITVGAWQLSPPWALIGCGVGLILLALLGSRMRAP